MGENLNPQCDICGNYFKRESNLKIHRKTVHGSKDVSSDSSQFCHKCKKVFSSKSNCTQHLRQCQVEVDEREVEDENEMDEDKDERRVFSKGNDADKIAIEDEQDWMNVAVCCESE